MVVHFVRACVGPVRECCRRRFVTLRGEALQFTIYNLLAARVGLSCAPIRSAQVS